MTHGFLDMSKYVHNSSEDFPSNKNRTCQISKLEVVLYAPDRVNKDCLMHGTHKIKSRSERKRKITNIVFYGNRDGGFVKKQCLRVHI